MITVTRKQDNDRISIEINGHAGFDEIGKDIVCAAASILSYTLRAVFCDSTTNGNAHLYEEKAEDGYMRFKMTVSQNREVVLAQVKAVFKGFELLEENYPEYVKTVITNADRKKK